MLHTGSRVALLTKKVGQGAPTGKIVAMHGESVEVRWDDGHSSVISRTGVTPLTPANRPHKGT